MKKGDDSLGYSKHYKSGSPGMNSFVKLSVEREINKIPKKKKPKMCHSMNELMKKEK